MKRFAFVFVLLAALAASAQDKSIRCEFTSQPSGASVIVDDSMCGVTPLTLYDLGPGKHHVRFSLPSYEDVDEFLFLREGGFFQKHAELVPVKGLLLLTSEPSGCDISFDGLSLGKTPRLVSTLDAKDFHRLLLQKPGYQNRVVEVKFTGRTPVVRHENLIVDSGTIDITSEPEGAEVTVNGIVRGTTPVVVGEVPKGRATVTLKRTGFEESVRELSMVAGESQTLFIKLVGIPGTMNLTSVPEGARFYVDNEPQGKSPVTLKGLKPGTYAVRAELDGYDTLTKQVEIVNGGSANEEFRMLNVMGRIEVRTKPAGVQVILDGKNQGATKSKSGIAETEPSDVFVIENVKSGEHSLVLRLDGYAEAVRHPTVENQKTAAVNVTMKRAFVPDVEVVTDSGSYRGVLVSNTAVGIEIETAPGMTRTFPSAVVRKINFLK